MLGVAITSKVPVPGAGGAAIVQAGVTPPTAGTRTAYPLVVHPFGAVGQAEKNGPACWPPPLVTSTVAEAGKGPPPAPRGEAPTTQLSPPAAPPPGRPPQWAAYWTTADAIVRVSAVAFAIRARAWMFW